MRLRRSELSVPGSSEKMLAKGAASDADMVFCDLEDAVAPNQKADARKQIVNALTTLDWGRKTRAIRINGPHTHWCHDDVIEVVTGAGDALDLIIVPKVNGPRDVWFVETLLDQVETKLGRAKPIALEVLIEESAALACVEEIARCSQRLEAIIFGPGDMSASQGVRYALAREADYPGDIWHHARARIVTAARAAGIDAVDGPFANFRDDDGYRKEALGAALMGFIGKWAIHPAQVPIANDVFSPTEREVSNARELVDAYRTAEEAGEGATGGGGMMVDAATARIMQVILDRAAAIEGA